MSGVEESGSSVPLFPLPRTVLFPNVDLPLHLFEPRYRAMAEDLTRGDRDPRIVVVLLRAGWEDDYYGNPPVHDVATLGRVVHHERLEDGRFNLVLRGTSRVRLHEPDLPPALRHRQQQLVLQHESRDVIQVFPMLELTSKQVLVALIEHIHGVLRGRRFGHKTQVQGAHYRLFDIRRVEFRPEPGADGHQ